ncbi:LacI family DNA-binding transcriptional regulator [Blastococcus deserti]|uniref:LacI family DNA-binding transcriptional regulator n=1 Tax=Blastococcus deserti TaxID=2259033 RepID=A0ABW4XFG0_9ACTN
MATIKEVAARAGVAPSTVSRLLNGDPTVRVRPETRLRVLSVAAELNYTPNRAARALRGTRVGALGVALRHLTSPVYAQIFSGAEDAARSADFLLVAIEVDALATDPAALHRFVPGRAVDGLLLQRDGLLADDVVLENVLATKLPFVIVNERVEDPLYGVALDDVRASRMATAHLLALGHVDVAHLAIGGTTRRALDRQEGWQQALSHAGLPAPPEMVAVGGGRPETGYAGMMELLANPVRPTGVVAGTLLAALGALAAIRGAGLQVPDDISVVTHHDSWAAEYASPPLTAVRLPLEELGRRAVQLLIERLDGAPPRQELLTTPEPQLIPRASTAPPRSADRRRPR